MRSLVTGGAGFLGSHLVAELLRRGHRVLVLDNLTGGWRDNVPYGASFMNLDLATDEIDSVLLDWRPDMVWHLAAYAAEGLSHWVRGFNYANNAVASGRLISASVAAGVKHFVFTSSMATYGSAEPPFTEETPLSPEDPYAAAKASVEWDLRAAGDLFGMPWTIFKPHNVYGPGQNIGDPYRNVVGIFMRSAMEGRPLPVFGDGEQSRAFSYVTDIIRPMARVLDVDAAGEVFNIGGEEVVTINTLAERVRALYPGVGVSHLPERYEVRHAWCDHSKARRLLGFEPEVGMATGLERMKEWAGRVGVRWSKTPRIELSAGLPEFWREVAVDHTGG